MMFDSLPWYLKNYIYENRWTSFRDIQLKTYETFTGTRDHILVTAATSGGKTEAAIFPVITDLHDNPGKGVTVVYIGPLKALIDDQFERMESLLKESGIRVTSWHGDASVSKKKKLIADPEGILQITPESLQNLIVNHRAEAINMFSGIRYIIIDEVHSFIGTDRGSQLLCCLEIIERMCGVKPRRIGLSATVSDVDYACEWMSANTGVATILVNEVSENEKHIDLRYYRYSLPEPDTLEERKATVKGYYTQLYKETVGKNCIIFTNNRSGAEKTSKSLKSIYAHVNRRDAVFTHHGSISKEFRDQAINALKSDDPSTVVATVTLELGIDVGNLDKIVQINTPYTCSGLVQRMGRSGRRGNAQDLLFICNDDMMENWNKYLGISMELVKAIALTELMLEGWVEPPKKIGLPYNLLYHQTIEYLKNTAGAKFHELVKEVLSLYPFSKIDKDDYKILLRHMINKDHLIKMEDGTLLIGEKAERLAYGMGFCAVFEDVGEIEVRFNGKTIGSIQSQSINGELILLAGRSWMVTSVEENYIEVVPAEGSAETTWSSGIPDTDTVVMKKMKEILDTSKQYPYISNEAKRRLDECRASSEEQGVTELFTPIDSGYRIHPWLGTIHFDTLSRILLNIPEIEKVRIGAPYYLEVETELSPEEILSEIKDLMKYGDKGMLSLENDDKRRKKFDSYIPRELLLKEFIDERLSTDFYL